MNDENQPKHRYLRIDKWISRSQTHRRNLFLCVTQSLPHLPSDPRIWFLRGSSACFSSTSASAAESENSQRRQCSISSPSPHCTRKIVIAFPRGAARKPGFFWTANCRLRSRPLPLNIRNRYGRRRVENLTIAGENDLDGVKLERSRLSGSLLCSYLFTKLGRAGNGLTSRIVFAWSRLGCNRYHTFGDHFSST